VRIVVLATVTPLRASGEMVMTGSKQSDGCSRIKA
jgi:hypothetical protein